MKWFRIPEEWRCTKGAFTTMGKICHRSVLDPTLIAHLSSNPVCSNTFGLEDLLASTVLGHYNIAYAIDTIRTIPE